jgi:vacuolar protein sorting-associated protein 13A/C
MFTETLMKFIDVAIPRFGDDELQEQAPVVIPADRKATFRQHRQIEEYTLDDTRSILSQGTLGDKEEEGSQDGKGNDQFYEAQDDTTDVGDPFVIDCMGLKARRAKKGRCIRLHSSLPFR